MAWPTKSPVSLSNHMYLNRSAEVHLVQSMPPFHVLGSSTRYASMACSRLRSQFFCISDSSDVLRASSIVAGTLWMPASFLYT